jgi:hypothetical protein
MRVKSEFTQSQDAKTVSGETLAIYIRRAQGLYFAARSLVQYSTVQYSAVQCSIVQ